MGGGFSSGHRWGILGGRPGASIIESKIILIDGEYLSKLMVTHNVGVSTVGQYEVKKLDSDYFDNE